MTGASNTTVTELHTKTFHLLLKKAWHDGSNSYLQLSYVVTVAMIRMVAELYNLS
jgi:hypothetical protein